MNALFKGRECAVEVVLLDGGGRGRTRSDRRACVSSVEGLLFDGGGRGRVCSDSRNTSQKLNEITLNQPTADSARYPFRFSGDRLDYRRVSLLVMPHLSYPTAVFLVATCIFVILAKLLKVGKGAVAMGVGVLIVWLVLHFTGYEETVYNIIFNPPPIQHAQPEDLIKR